MIWQAIDELGNTSEPFLCPGKMNQHVYLEECLKKRLIPFIKKYHNLEDVLFWPDLATCHYAKLVQNYLQQEKVDFLQKKKNPPNVPQARGIDKFWSMCKEEYSARKVPAKNDRSFIQIWR